MQINENKFKLIQVRVNLKQVKPETPIYFRLDRIGSISAPYVHNTFRMVHRRYLRPKGEVGSEILLNRDSGSFILKNKKCEKRYIIDYYSDEFGIFGIMYAMRTNMSYTHILANTVKRRAKDKSYRQF